LKALVAINWPVPTFPSGAWLTTESKYACAIMFERRSQNDQQFIHLLQHGTLVSMENEAPIVSDFD
jgi:hypothetical protein